MAAYLLFNTLTTFHGSSGELLAGGELRFFQTNTTTPQDVYGNRALSVNNGNAVALDASGRLTHECWADTTASYYVELYDADGVKQGQISYIEVPGGQGQVIPVPSPGEFLTGDGVNFLLEDLSDRFLPDQTGHSNEILGTDGATASWVARPQDGAPGVSDISVGTDSVRIGTFLIQFGTDSAPSTGTDTTTKAITFPTAFSETPKFVKVTVTNGPSVNGTSLVADAVTSASTTGCTINFNNADRHFDGSSKLTSAIPFQWVAMGKVTVP